MAGDRETCGQLLRRFRQRARLSQEDLAERSGYSASYLSKLERDERQPPLVALDRLADILGLKHHDREALQAARERHQPAPEPLPPTRLPPPPAPELNRLPPPLPLPPTPLLGREVELAA